MPEICRFYGIIISINYDDHNPPHLHADYGSYSVLISIIELKVLQGKFPNRGLNLVLDWAKKNQKLLLDNWELARQGKPLIKIDPLK